MTQQNNNYGRDQYVINQPGTIVLPEQKPRPRAEQLLLQAVQDEVTARLRQSLHNAVLIQLGMSPQPDQVNRPWDSDIKIGDRSPVPIPADTPIIDIFDHIGGKLLILGAPGSGKTTTMLELAKGLCDRAVQQPDYPIPVLFNLSTWKDDRQSMQEWLIAELKSKYGVRKDIGKGWVESRQLLPLLDGLDELEATRQESCAKAINKLLESDDRPPYLVVCSRLEEYNTYSTTLELNGAICLRELDDSQIGCYLTSAQQPQLWHLFQADPSLLELVRKPLLLSISVLSGQELATEQWHTLSSTSDRLQHLLDAYVRRMMTRELKTIPYGKHKPPNPTKTRHWLTVLAGQLRREFQTEFLIEDMQPSWLQTDQQYRSYQLILGLMFTLTSSLMFGLLGGLRLIVMLGLMQLVGLILGLRFLDKNVNQDVIILMEFLQISRFHEVKQQVLSEFLKNLISGLVIGLITGVASGLLGQGLIIGLILGLIIGVGTMPVHLILKLRILALETGTNIYHVQPNQGIWNSAKNTFKSAGVTFVSLTPILAGFLWFLLSLNILDIYLSISICLFFSTLIVLSTALVSGGLACTQHFALRFVLFHSGSIPWHYARFLDYCTDRLLLQRVGGRYRFIHRLLQEHFAAMPLKGE